MLSALINSAMKLTVEETSKKALIGLGVGVLGFLGWRTYKHFDEKNSDSNSEKRGAVAEADVVEAPTPTAEDKKDLGLRILFKDKPAALDVLSVAIDADADTDNMSVDDKIKLIMARYGRSDADMLSVIMAITVLTKASVEEISKMTPDQLPIRQ